MNRTSLYKLSFLLVLLLVARGKTYSQDTLKVKVPLGDMLKDLRVVVELSFDYMDRYPDKEDQQNISTYGYLLDQQPDSANYQQYYSLAISLWQLRKDEQAEKMLLRIIASDGAYYTMPHYYASDLGDSSIKTKRGKDRKTKMTYGYGSYDYSYKNNAAICLTKIYLENGNYRKALLYLEDAVNKYKTTYSCGTGYNRQKEEYTFLYASIYEGLGQYDKVMELLLPESVGRDDQIIVRTIKKIYTKEQINEKLQEAENSIIYKVDVEESYTYIGPDTLRYYSGSGTFLLFDKQVPLPRPYMNDGERVTKEHFLRRFRGSSFYRNLAPEQ